MKVFKYLVALADISVGFLGLFFVIFAVTRPTLSSAVSEKRRLERDLQQLREDIRQLQEIKLAKAGAARQPLSANAAKIIITAQALTVELEGRQTRFATLAAFAAASQNWRWPASVVLYVDHRLPFQQVVGVIDALKHSHQDLAVQIAALTK